MAGTKWPEPDADDQLLRFLCRYVVGADTLDEAMLIF